MERVIEKTDDGSATLFVPELNEHYHSTKGAHTESQHIFVDMGLKVSSAPSPRILEIGFGTGLNAWLTLEEAERSGRNVHYTGVELYPLQWDMVEQLGYVGKKDEPTAMDLFRQIHTSIWEKDIPLTPHFTLRKVQADIHHFCEFSQERADVIYFDAFAPEKQPEMWTEELFHRLYVLLNEGGLLTTYCAKGIVRRMLQAAGFTVERIPGPPGGKREILRAWKQAQELETGTKTR